MNIRAYQHPHDEIAVVELWRRCNLLGPINDPRKDIARKLKVNPEMFLVGEIEGQIVATVMAGYEGHRGWINFVAVDPKHQRKGFGRILMQQAEKLLHDAGCPKINLQVRTANCDVIEFYKRMGYNVDDVLSMGKRLEWDR